MNGNGDDLEGFVAFCDGLEAAGQTEYAHRGRAIAARLTDTLELLGAERSARVAMQERIERLEQLLARR